MNILAIEKSYQNIRSEKEQTKLILEALFTLVGTISAIVPGGVEKRLTLEEKLQKVLEILRKAGDNKRKLLIGSENLFEKNLRYRDLGYQELFALIKC